MHEWADKLKSGDKVIVDSPKGQYVWDVVRVTKTLIIASCYGNRDVKFNKKTLKEHGFGSCSGWLTPSIIEYSECKGAEIEKRHKISKLIHKISDQDLSLLPIEAIEEISKIIDAAIKIIDAAIKK